MSEVSNTSIGAGGTFFCGTCGSYMARLGDPCRCDVRPLSSLGVFRLSRRWHLVRDFDTFRRELVELRLNIRDLRR